MNICHFHLGANISGVGSYVDRFYNHNNANFFRVDSKLKKTKDANSYSLINLGLFGFLLFESLGLLKFFNRNNIGIIHVHTLKALLYIILLYPFWVIKGIKIIYTGHGIRFDQKKGIINRLLFKYIEVLLLLFVNKIIYIRKYDFDLGIKKIGYQHKSAYIPTRMNIKRTRIVPKQNSYFHIYSVGSVIDIKDPYTFIKIAEKVVYFNSNVKFFWVGDGALLNECKALILKKNLENNVFFIGERKKSEVIELLDNDASLYLCTSKIETFPISFIEALSCHNHIVSLPLNGLESEFGQAVTYLNWNEIVKFIVNYSTDEKEMFQMSEISYLFYNQILSNEGEMLNSHLKMYEEL